MGVPSPRLAHAAGGTSADAVTDAVLAASWLLVGLSARSIASVDESITMSQFRLLIFLNTRGPLNTGRAGRLPGCQAAVGDTDDRPAGEGLVDR